MDIPDLHNLPINHPKRREFAQCIGPDTWDFALAFFASSDQLVSLIDALPRHLRQKKERFPAQVGIHAEKPLQSFTPSSIDAEPRDVKPLGVYTQRSFFDELD